MEKIQQVDLAMMLDARERRSFRQRELLEQYQRPLISFSMNIAGPVKNTPLIRRGFTEGRRQLLERIREAGGKILFQEETDEATGCEGMYITDLDEQKIKQLTCAVEEETAAGRLYDMDVIDTCGNKLERPAPRRCLICGKPAKECARSRTHSVAELQEATGRVLKESLDQSDRNIIASRTVQALLYEVCVTPKPGLVDRNDSGSHADMDIYTFMASASALWPYFASCAETGMESAELPAPETLKRLRNPGKEAERRMYRMTAGINTHKGAIFSMGILCAAFGRLAPQDRYDSDQVLAEAAAMTAGITERELHGVNAETAVTAGQKIYAAYGIAGIRGEAEAGFPAVREHGLPVLEEGLKSGKSRDEAGRAALLAIIASTPDTNMIHRGGIALQKKTAAQAAEILKNNAYPDADTMAQLNAEYINERLSPGGSADLLAVCWLMHFLKEERA